MLAIDASTFLYQFLVAIRTGAAATHLANAEGDATSHIAGFLQRTVRILEAGDWTAPGGIKPNQRLLIVSATYMLPAAVTEKGSD